MEKSCVKDLACGRAQCVCVCERGAGVDLKVHVRASIAKASRIPTGSRESAFFPSSRKNISISRKHEGSLSCDAAA